jgi:hypothetical protein
LFNIYVNDMSSAVKCKLLLYADDALLLIKGKTIKEIERSLNSEMKCLYKWLVQNKLSLHLGKTESILFSTKKKLNGKKLKVKCSSKEIKSVTSVKYLGALIDQDLSGNSMGNKVIKKVNGGLKFMFRKKDFINFNERKLLCCAMLQSHFDYAVNTFYYDIDCKLKEKLHNAQNKMIRFILGYDYRRHLVCNDFKICKFLSVSYRIEYLSLNLMYKIFNNLAPSYFSDYKLFTDVHKYETRNSNSSYVIPKVNTKGKLTFNFHGIKLWNSLPINIRNSNSLSHFKYECKKYLFNKMLREETDVVYF